MTRVVKPHYQQLFIFDLDGTLADYKHRQHMLDPALGEGRHKKFYEACGKDTPIVPIITMMQKLFWGLNDIWIWTGRSDAVERQTRLWLDKHTPLRGHYDKVWLTGVKLKMRSKKDSGTDDEIKERWLNEMDPRDRERLVCVFEDRQRVVDMWRRNGITCLQVAPGDF